MSQSRYLFLPMLAILCLSLPGCASGPRLESTREYVADSWITAKVKTALLEDSQVRSSEVKVETYKGTVQLSGFVSSDASVQRAVEVARATRGVSAVQNDMRLK